MRPATIEQVAELSVEQFEQQIAGKPIVILYPRHRGRSALVAMFLRHYGPDTLYYSLGAGETTLEKWLGCMVDDPAFPDGFGAQLRKALKGRAKPEDLAAALGADLERVPGQAPAMLLLDMFDHLRPSKAIDRFFRALPDALPGQWQVVINARLLRLQPWNDLVLAGQAAVVGADQAPGGGIYGDVEKRGQLEVFALSGGRVYADGRPVTSWEGLLPRHLFYFLVDHPMVTRDQIFEVFWPNMPVKEATNVFHVTKRKISERLGFELTHYGSGFYTPSPKIEVHYDVRVFETAVQQALENEQSAPQQWALAVQLYRADYLPAVHTPWAQARRAELQNKYAEALIGLGRHYLRAGEPALAQGYLLRALREKPDWEDVHRDVMALYRSQGRRSDAAAQYRQLEATLKRMFNIPPSRETRALYESIAQG